MKLPNQVEDGVSMTLLTDTDADGACLGRMITTYLDEEWIEQEVHKRLGELVTREYVQARTRGVTDVGESAPSLRSSFYALCTL